MKFELLTFAKVSYTSYRMSFYRGPSAFEMLEEQEMCMTTLYIDDLRQICVMLSCFGKG